MVGAGSWLGWVGMNVRLTYLPFVVNIFLHFQAKKYPRGAGFCCLCRLQTWFRPLEFSADRYDVVAVGWCRSSLHLEAFVLALWR